MALKNKHRALKREINKLSQLRLKTSNKYNIKNKQHKMKRKWKRRTLEIIKIQVTIKNRSLNQSKSKRRTLKKAKIKMITKKHIHLQKLQGVQKAIPKHKKSQNQRKNKREITHLNKVLIKTRLKYSTEKRTKAKANQRKRKRKPKMIQTAHLTNSQPKNQREKVRRRMSSIRHPRKRK